MNKRFLIILVMIVLILTSVSCGKKPVELEPLEGDIMAFSGDIVEKLIAKDFDGVYDYFNTDMRKALPVRKLEPAWKQLTNQFGSYQHEVARDKIITEGNPITLVIVTGQFEKALIDIRISFDSDNRVAGLYFALNQEQTAESYTSPSYANPDSFTEKEVTVGQGEWALPGTLTIPDGEGPHPAVVLVHGSGPNDRDETIGPNKPFKDLAWGLASQGIAVLRYEKRTKEHGLKMTPQLETLTPKEEVIDDALAAVSLLRKTKEVDPSKIYVLGHSLGGTLAPRIGEEGSEVAGLILLAGAARPLEDVILNQVHYLVELDGTVTDEEKTELDLMEARARRVKDPGLTPDTSPSFLPLGMPAPYWLYLRDYNPAQTAKSLNMPLLILQGERDYQVTMQDFAEWRLALKDRKETTLKSYPYLNHLFIPGEGTSTPAEYLEPGNVSVDIVNDIVTWVQSQQP
jgi:dienelactone hydrolase